MSKIASVIAYHGTRGGFDQLDPDKSGLGTHFGDYRTAVKRMQKLRVSNPNIRKYRLNISKSLHMPDVGMWEEPLEVAWELVSQGVFKKQEEEAEDFKYLSESEMWTYLRGKIESAGYDSVVYPNVWEGGGSVSYIVWDNSKIQRLFDAKTPKHLRKTGSDITPVSPLRADHRFLKKLVSSLLGGKVEEVPSEFDFVSKMFLKAEGSWERVFRGSPWDIQLLKEILKWALKKGKLTKKRVWGATE